MAHAVLTSAPAELLAALTTGGLSLAFHQRDPAAEGAATTANAAVGGALASQTDEALLCAIRAADHAAFNELLRRHLDSVHSYLFRLTRSAADAEDLAQETFLRVWQKAHTFQPGRVQVTTWIHRIAHNLCVDQFRKQREVTGLDVEEHSSEASVSEFDRYASAEASTRLEAAITQLPENQRAAVLLCQVQGFSNTQAAQILGVGVRALESLLARGRKSLRRALTEGDH